MSKVISSIFLALFLGFVGCSSKKEYINIYDKNITKSSLSCLGLIAGEDDRLSSSIESLYKFDKNCRYKIEFSYKRDIVCNSSFNSSLKANTAFPNSYLRLELKDNNATLLFSYYVDLTSAVSDDDIKRAFEVMREYIKID